MFFLKKSFFVFAGLMCAATTSFSQTASYRVLESAGQAEVFDAALGSWQGLSPGAVLKKGAKIRTGADGSAEISEGSLFENAVYIGPGSEVTFLNEEPSRIALDRGTLWIIRETLSQVRVLTREYLVTMQEGGCAVEADGSQVAVKVFGESVQVFDKTPSGYSDRPRVVEEGFRYRSGNTDRMDYPDYIPWQKWTRKNDERKDKLIPRP